MNNLLIITGAGASYDAVDSTKASIDDSFRPPLTRDLFASGSGFGRPSFVAQCLNKHHIAAQVGYYFMASGQREQGLEEYLTALKKSRLQLKRSQYWATIPYLQELFYRISTEYILTKKGIPSNYKALIDGVAESPYNQILWLNLNYDLLADCAIKASTYNMMNSIRDYMLLETRDGLKIKYTKPHGSADWFMEVKDPGIDRENIMSGDIPADFEDYLDKATIYTRTEVRKHPSAGSWPSPYQYSQKWFPAMTAPIGEYEYIFANHIDVMKPDLKETTALLCIGFSALDKDILKLIKEMPAIRKLLVANGPIEDSRVAYDRMVECCGNIQESKEYAAYNGGFTHFVQHGMKKWLSE